LNSGPAPYEAGQARGLLTQEEGLKRLSSFLYLESSAQLSPFILRTPSARKLEDVGEVGASRQQYCYSLLIKDKRLELPVPKEIREANREYFWVFPRVLNRGEKPYYWLEFYDPLTVVDLLPKTVKNMSLDVGTE
jgi:hypothetical protein